MRAHRARQRQAREQTAQARQLGEHLAERGGQAGGVRPGIGVGQLGDGGGLGDAVSRLP